MWIIWIYTFIEIKIDIIIKKKNIIINKKNINIKKR